MEFQTIKENGKVKFVVLPIDQFEALLDRAEDQIDIRAIHAAEKEPLYDQVEAEAYIFMNPVKRERLERNWTQQDLARQLGVKQSTIAKWERRGASYRKETRKKLSSVFGIAEDSFI